MSWWNKEQKLYNNYIINNYIILIILYNNAITNLRCHKCKLETVAEEQHSKYKQ